MNQYCAVCGGYHDTTLTGGCIIAGTTLPCGPPAVIGCPNCVVLERELAEARDAQDRTLAEIKRCLLALGGSEDRPVAVLADNEYLADGVRRVVSERDASRAEVTALKAEALKPLSAENLKLEVQLEDARAELERAFRAGWFRHQRACNNPPFVHVDAAWTRYQQERQA